MSSSTTTVASGGVAVSVQNAMKRYGTTQALDDVSFEIAGGSFVAILGPSGAGKTTLVRALSGMIRPDSGQVMVGGKDLASLRDRPFGPPKEGSAWSTSSST